MMLSSRQDMAREVEEVWLLVKVGEVGAKADAQAMVIALTIRENFMFDLGK